MDLKEKFEAMSRRYGVRRPETPEEKLPEVEVPERPGIPGSWKTNPNKYENQFFMDLMILRNSLTTKADKVADRLRMVNPHARRDLSLLLSLVDRLQTQLADTMPDTRSAYYAAIARHGRYHFTTDGPIKGNEVVIISTKRLAQLCEAVMENECVLCMRDGEQIERCPIRDVLLEVAPPTETQLEGATWKCEYAGAAGQLVEGKDVTI